MAKAPKKATKKPLRALKPVKRKPAAKKTTKKTAAKDLSVYILLDRSGSMQSLWDEALSSINTYVHELEGPTKATMAVFDSGGYDVVRDTTAATWKDVTNTDAHPRGMTPLYDSAGKMLDRMYADNPKSGVFVVMTDGYENASSEYTRTTILSRIEAAKKDKNWQVIFLGAEFNDVGAVSSSLGVGKGQTVNMTTGNMGATMRGLATYTTSYAATATPMSFTDEDRVTAGEIKKNTVTSK